MKEAAETYEGFDYPANELNKYLFTAGIFTVMLANGKIINHSPDDCEAFKAWLETHAIPDIRQSNF